LFVEDDGLIDFNEMKLFIRCCLEQSPSLDMEETVAELTASLFEQTNIDRSNDITLDELFNAFQSNEHLFNILSLRCFVHRVEQHTIVEFVFMRFVDILSVNSWIQPKPIAIRTCQENSSTVRSWLRNHVDLIFFWSIYFLVCIIIAVDILHVYVKQHRAHSFVVIARINGKIRR
jgi:hypothetical protein